MKPIDPFKLLTDWGPLIVMSGTFLYFIIRLMNIFFQFIENKMGKVRHDKALSIREEVGLKVQSLIGDFLQVCDGDRVQVIEFSNSVMSIAYLPFKYMSCTYEVYKFGKSPIGHRMDRMATSLFSTFFGQMEDCAYCKFDVENKPPYMGGAMYDIMLQSGSRRELCSKLVTSKGKFIGYISLMKDEEFTDLDIERIQEVSTKVTTLLSVLDR